LTVVVHLAEGDAAGLSGAALEPITEGMLIKDGQYAGIDLGFSAKMSSAFWAFDLGITVVLLPLYPPTHAFGIWGWVLVAVSMPLSILFAITLRRHPERMTMDRLFVQACASATQIAFLEWMAGGGSAPYGELLGFALFGVALGHPLRRSIPFAAYVVALTFLPLLYRSHGFPIGMVATSIAVSLSIATFVALTMSHARGQRARLAKEGDAARSESLTDNLTGLGNRRAFNHALETAIEQGRGLVMLLDIDNFKTINDNHGHPVGDECLIACALALRESVRSPDSCFRWGGDEFAVLLSEPCEESLADAVAQRARERMRSHFRLPDGSTPGLTYGAAPITPTSAAAAVLDDADVRLLERKRVRKVGRSFADAPASAAA